jgi:hypothetical protein
MPPAIAFVVLALIVIALFGLALTQVRFIRRELKMIPSVPYEAEPDPWSGSIRFDGEVIRNRSKLCGDWDLHVVNIRIIGESTNQDGPAIDYFLCFATGPDTWFEASFYANGRDAVLSALGEKLGTQLDLHLCNSTDFANRVLWPPSLVGKPMFQYSRSWWVAKQTFSDGITTVLTKKS